ncbi:MFS transporter [Jatrophihabitans telluris]|uniref:MFS transporter n=1 Tax=Jatrophihabitans telluris TaxID=2038343 RepID=A0ABY4R235_9ACTN|nr:MFS transporter [Jatrophihabitans telluris]UQX89094.1 MFS transporter [Jatrophihabitans telluris]
MVRATNRNAAPGAGSAVSAVSAGPVPAGRVSAGPVSAGRVSVGPVPAGPNHQRLLLIAAFVLTGFTMRSAVSSVGSLLTGIQDGLSISSGRAGVITTLPVLCFAVLGSWAPRWAHRFGTHRLVVAALAIATLGMASRAIAPGYVPFLLLSVLALAGAAMANVLMPSLVKQHFPDEVGRMTAAYTTALAIGMTAAAGLSVPLANAAGSWRFGLGFWTIFAAAALVPWLPTVRGDRPDRDADAIRIPLPRLARSSTAWALTIMFAFQSMQAYVSIGWFAAFFKHEGLSPAHAGWLVAFYAALSIPISVIIPAWAVRDARSAVLGMVTCSAVAYIGLWLAPLGGSWLWMCLAGIGSGMFPLTLTFIGLRSRAVPVTAALSAFVQTVGYVVAGTGPLLVGFLLDRFHQNWDYVFVILLAALIVSGVGGLAAAAGRPVDSQLPR